ncbi:MAG: class I SAM-dependent methyltransferase [Burkholderiales bacterium]
MNLAEPCAPFPRPTCGSAFDDSVIQRGFDPADRWIRGYVDYEWCHARHVFEQSGVVLKSKRVLEFGCNLGATAIVLAHLGALVDAVDIDPAAVEIATLNAAQYELAHPIRFAHVSDSTALPFADAYFDAVVCNSVLEYVDAAHLREVQSALARVLKPGGLLIVLGTSSRFSPREVHSRRWLVNYLPALFDSMVHSPGPPQRGVWPGALRRGFGSDFEDLDWHDHARAYLLARKAMGAGYWHVTSLAAMALLARPFGWSVGMMTPNLSLRLRKKEVEATV